MNQESQIMGVTIKDVAKMAGVSTSTVSRTCSDHPSISQQTKEKVRNAMKQLGYEPNNSNLSIQNTRTIGIILPASEFDTFENPFYLEAMRGITLFCNQKNYSTTLITGSSQEEIINTVQYLSKENRIDGVILLYSMANDPLYNYLESESILFVLIGKKEKNNNDIIYVDNDNILAAKDATKYLLELGHTRIGYISKECVYTYCADRKSGYMISLTEAGLPFDPNLCLELETFPRENVDEIKHYFSKDNVPSAVLVSDDILGLAVEKAAFELGIKIPDDLSIVSFNNSIFAKLCTPQLTSIDVNNRQLGIEAASQIINHIENPGLLATKIIVPYYLVERNSCSKHQ